MPSGYYASNYFSCIKFSGLLLSTPSVVDYLKAVENEQVKKKKGYTLNLKATRLPAPKHILKYNPF